MTNLANSAEPFDIVIRRVRVFDGKEALPGLRDVGLHGGAIGAVSEAPLQGRRDIEGKGGWMMPGLIDTHLHFFDFTVVTDPDSLAEFVENTAPVLLQQFLACGVTTIKSVGDPTTEVLELRAKLAAGTLRGPQMLTTGNGLTGRDGHPASTIFGGNPWFRARATGEVDSPEMMRDLVHHLADRGVDAIKLLSEGGCWCPGSPKYLWKNPVFPNAVELVRLPTKILRAGIEAAHEHGLRVTVHTVQQDAAIEALEAGADGLEHGVTVEPITDKALIDLMIERKATYASTLWIHDAVHPHTRPNTKLMADAGVTMVLGSDSFCGRGAFGQNTIEEAELLEAAGLTPQQVLVAATSNAAGHLDRADIGTVAPGKRADLILVADDPLASIGNLRKLTHTILNGEVVVDRS
ncbi:amidohydrolase [Sphingomonas sp. AAP5]|uniref:amidohydrolase family protein n=1 Tax=Sphingomonas sp. AAP5 TaxID=1523415 RepID=UPI0010573164|nr:amidohydrolase family protein [Sphingomonas sp. AAP5]QBM75152.1 amidohydrolase [Sphingomonas sp. AAP5]